jgi:hypothetical protein
VNVSKLSISQDKISETSLIGTDLMIPYLQDLSTQKIISSTTHEVVTPPFIEDIYSDEMDEVLPPASQVIF